MSSDNTNENGENKEARILRVMRQVLTTIVKDTATAPGVKHPLSDATVEDIRQCLGLIATREQEILRENGIDNNMKPRFTDDPAAQESVVVPIGKLKSRHKSKDK